MQIFWRIVGVLLIGWVIWDLYFGYTFIKDIVYRDEEPGLYWAAVGVWAILGVSCFFSWHQDK
jgi:hypothetical protein